MSKSDNIYNALDYARNKLKSATEAKGAAVASPYSLMDIAAAVQTIENGLEVGVLVSAGTGLKVQPLGFEVHRQRRTEQQRAIQPRYSIQERMNRRMLPAPAATHPHLKPTQWRS